MFTFHLKETATADLPARAAPITEPAARRAILGLITTAIEATQDLDAWVERSPLVEVQFEQ